MAFFLLKISHSLLLSRSKMHNSKLEFVGAKLLNSTKILLLIGLNSLKQKEKHKMIVSSMSESISF